jgi:membrane peptidoglycan carboxypeptidase
MARRRQARTFKTRGGHRPRARLHAVWSPIGHKARRASLIRAFSIAGTMILLVGVGIDAYAEQFLQSLPAPNFEAASLFGDTIIVARDGRVLADIGEKGDHRLLVQLKDVSPKMIQATIAIEDKNFYKNQGYDPEGILRAALSNYRSGTIVGGGSTITQQLAKQLFLTPERTVDRKMKEVVLAYEITQKYSKNQILELYLNNTYYGNQSYGVEAAARSYFHKYAKDLTLGEAAMLAGLPSAPTEWNPVLHPEDAKVRQKEVLQAMVRNNAVTPEEADKAAAEPINASAPINTFLAPHFVDFVTHELEQLGFTRGRQQLTVKTTLDLDRQQWGEQVVRENVAEQAYRDPQGQLGSSLVSMDPRNGEILVMVGSPDYNANGGQINLVADRSRNPGSSVKVYTYGAALAAGKATMDTVIYDGPSPFTWKTAYEKWDVYNYDRSTHGNLPLRRALGNSLNIPAVKTELTVGVPTVIDWMRNMGVFPRVSYQKADGSWYQDPKGNLNDYGPSLTLGGYPFTMLEHVTGEATYANGGVYHDPESILSVTDAKGKVLYQANPDRSRRQAVDPGVAFILSEILSNNNNRYPILSGFTDRLVFDGHHVAVKTGTTDDFRDALTTGWTPRMATVLWVGDILDIAWNHRMQAGSDSISVAAPAFHRYMEKALEGIPDEWYQPPANVVFRQTGFPGGSWFLNNATDVSKLSIDNLPSPSPSPIHYEVPPDPGGPRVIVSPTGRGRA